jgi:hypothetical protein
VIEYGASGAPAKRRALLSLRALPRSPLACYARRALDAAREAARPVGPLRSRTRYLQIRQFLGSNLLAWITSYLRNRFGPRHVLPDYRRTADSGVYPLNSDGGSVRVSMAGDWASGTDEAAAVAAAISAWHPHFTIHLGDVYYVGDEAEARSTFLGERTSSYQPTRWPRGSIATFALNGNHEMYARGMAYFDVLLPRLGFTAGVPQRASFFCLENQHWRILALDTGYNSVAWPLLEELPFAPFAPANDLSGAQMRWLAQTLGSDQGQALVILSHHPPYSRFERGYVKPARQLKRLLRGPVLWFWGHEHRLAVYHRYSRDGGIEAYGRGVGHGGMPVELHPRVVDDRLSLAFTDARRYPNEQQIEVGYNGYANLTFTGNSLEVVYRDLHGDAVFSESWRAAAGALTPIAVP